MSANGTLFQSLGLGVNPVVKQIECTKCGRVFVDTHLICPQCEQPTYVSIAEMPELIKTRSKAGKDAPHAFGWEVEVEFSDASRKPNAVFRYRSCTYRAAYRNGMLKSNASRIVAMIPVTEEQWLRAYGIGRM